MQISAVRSYQNNVNANYTQPAFNGVVKRLSTKQSKGTDVFKTMRPFKNYILFAPVAIAAMLAAFSGCKKMPMEKDPAAVESINKGLYYDSVAWAEFEKWDEEHIPYWDKPGYEGPILKEDFLAWQQSVNDWWQSYYEKLANQ